MTSRAMRLLRVGSVVLLALLVLLTPHQTIAFLSSGALMSGGKETVSPSTAVFPLSVSSNGRFLQSPSTKPFLMTGDAAWSLYTVPTVTGPTGGTQENIQNYFATRASQGFNTILLQVLCGNYCGNSNQNAQDGAGNLPFTGYLSSGATGTCNGTSSSTLPDCYDMSTPNSVFFQRICGVGAADGNACETNSIVGLAAQYGMLVVLLTVDPSGCPGITTPLGTPAQAPDLFALATNNGSTAMFNFGTYLAGLFKNQPNVVWLGSEDFFCYEVDGYDTLFASTLRGLTSGGDTHLKTAELTGYNSATKDDTTTNGMGQVTAFNAIYTYWSTYFETLHGYNTSDTPNFIVETNYEWHNTNTPEPSWSGCPSPASPGVPCLFESTIRKGEWSAILSGGSGELWGNYFTENMGDVSGWQNEMGTVGATQFANYWKSLLTSNQWWNLTPDQTSSVLTNPGTPISGVTSPDFTACTNPCTTGDTYSTAAYANSTLGSTVIAYIPGTQSYSGGPGSNAVGSGTINMTVFGSNPTCQWFDPTNGAYSSAGSGLTNTGTHAFTPGSLNSAGDADWVLLCTAAQK